MEEAAKAQAIYLLDALKQQILRNEIECTGVTEEEVYPECGSYLHHGVRTHVAGLLPKRKFVIECQPRLSDVQMQIEHIDGEVKARTFTPEEAVAFDKFLETAPVSEIKGTKLPVIDDPLNQTPFEQAVLQARNGS